jgi:hypothetical protein
MCRPEGRRYVPCRAQARRYGGAQGVQKCLACAGGFEGLVKILRGGEINPALVDQLRARIISQPGTYHVADLFLGKGLLLRPQGQRQNYCDDEHEDGYDRSTPHRHLPQAGITTMMCGHSTTGSSCILIAGGGTV